MKCQANRNPGPSSPPPPRLYPSIRRDKCKLNRVVASTNAYSIVNLPPLPYVRPNFCVAGRTPDSPMLPTYVQYEDGSVQHDRPHGSGGSKHEDLNWLDQGPLKESKQRSYST